MNLLDIFFPKRCVGCGAVGRYICSICAATMQSIGPNEAICPVCEKHAIGGATHPGCATSRTPDGLFSFFRYRTVVQRAIKSLKYRYVTDLVEELVTQMPLQRLSNVVPASAGTEIIVPVPLHPDRLRARGFNQAELFGTHIAAFRHSHLRPDKLMRKIRTVPQVDMTGKNARVSNMRRVFAVRPRSFTDVERVILVDDVFTTGATIRDAARALKAWGVGDVWAVTIAR